MSEELLLNSKRVEKQLTTPGFEKSTSQSVTRSTAHSAISPCFFDMLQLFLF